MGVCVTFHRTWTPGYGEYIDPNRLSRFHRRLALLKKFCAAVFAAVLLSALVLLLYLLYSQCNYNCPDCKAGTTNNGTAGDFSAQSSSNVTHAPVTEAFAGPLGRIFHATKSSEVVTKRSFEEEEKEVDRGGPVEEEAKYVDKLTPDNEEKDSVVQEETVKVGSDVVEVITTRTTTTTTTTTTTKPTTTPTSEAELIMKERMVGSEGLVKVSNLNGKEIYPDEGGNNTEDDFWGNWDDDEEENSTIGNITAEPTTMTTSETVYETFDSSYDLKPDDEESLLTKTGSKRDSPGSTFSTSSIALDGCKESEFQCTGSRICIPVSQRCNGIFDCNDFSTTTSPDVLYLHGDRSDELNCTCEGNLFACNVTNKPECIHNSLICDTVSDCSNGKDEQNCLELSLYIDTIYKKSWTTADESGIEGHVLVRVKGSWHPYCYNKWSTDFAERICWGFNYTKVVELDTIPLVDLNKRGLASTFVDEDTKIVGYGGRFFVIDRQTEKPFPMTSGTVDEIATETSIHADGLNCTIAYISCANSVKI